MFDDYISQLQEGNNLSQQQAESVLAKILDNESISETKIADFLTLMTEKGATTDEILGFIDAMQMRMNKVNAPANSIDVCGTGGDKSNSFNISTASAIVLAGGGVNVAKHGNRSASSKCGSADVLEELGIPIDLDQSLAENYLAKQGFVFLFAQKYHPALKRLAIVRKQLAFPTVFNLLGPLLNPAGVKRQVIGTFSEQNANIIAEVVSRRNYEKAIILTSRDGLDEASLEAPTLIIEIEQDTARQYEIEPKDLGIEPVANSEFVGGEANVNAQIIKDALSSNGKDTKAQIIALNAGIGFFVAGKTSSIQAGYKLALKVIESGKARTKLEELSR